MAEIAYPECGYRVNVVRTGPNSAKPDHVACFSRRGAAYQRLPLSYTLVAVIGQRPELHRVPRFAALPHSSVAQRNMERAKQNCSGESGSRVPVSARQARRQLT